MEEKYEKLLKELTHRYLAVFQGVDFKYLFEDTNLSGLFLPKPDISFISSKRKVMIIGQETKRWRNNTCEAKNLKLINTETIRSSMNASLAFNTKKPKKSKFRQFYKNASAALCKDSSDPTNSALWSNQFCISYKEGSPVKSGERFDIIKSLSSKLLQAQFDILEPDVAIFTVGSARDKYIKESFKCEESNVIEPRRLWYFRIANTHCFRTNHPRSPFSPRYLKGAIDITQTFT